MNEWMNEQAIIFVTELQDVNEVDMICKYSFHLTHDLFTEGKFTN